MGLGSAKWLLEMEMECRKRRECGWARPVCPPPSAADVLLISTDHYFSVLPALYSALRHFYTRVWQSCVASRRQLSHSLTFKTQMELNVLLMSIEFAMCVGAWGDNILEMTTRCILPCFFCFFCMFCCFCFTFCTCASIHRCGWRGTAWRCRGPGVRCSRWTGLSPVGCSPSCWCGSTGCGRECRCTRTWMSWCGRQSGPWPRPGGSWWRTGCRRSWRLRQRCASGSLCPNSGGPPGFEGPGDSPGGRHTVSRSLTKFTVHQEVGSNKVLCYRTQGEVCKNSRCFKNSDTKW